MIMKLTSYPNEDFPYGCVETLKYRGKRIVIVIDDYFQIGNWYDLEIPPPNANGLKRLYDLIRDWDLSRAIGFFTLPNPNQVKEDSFKIISYIDEWITTICCEGMQPSDKSCVEVRSECEYFILVDIFFGSEFPVANDFINCWKEKQIIPVSQEKIAYLSNARPPAQGYQNLPFFQKSKVDDFGQAYYELTEWLNYIPAPLEDVWQKTTGWFDDSKSDLVKHDFSKVKHYFEDRTYKAAQYRQAVENALKVQFPDAWWQDLDSIQNIHESLKHLCGEVFCGNSNKEGRRNISVGATYLIALKAHQDIYKNINVLADNPSFWRGVSKVTSAIFPLQEKTKARASALSLYEFFYRIFEPRGGSLQISQVKTAYFEQGGAVLKIQLKWRAPDIAKDRSRSLVQQLADRFDREEIDAPDPESYGGLAKNTKDAISRLWRSMMFNDYGFMSPGVIYMYGDEIIIASTEDMISGDGNNA